MAGPKNAPAADAHGAHSHASATGDHEQFPPAFERFRREMDAGMDTMMKDMHAPGYTGNVDVDFLAMMIPHHAGAVEMARLVLVYGNDPLTRQLADEIIASQTAEIAAMKRRLEILRVGADPEPGGFPTLNGTRGSSSR